MKPYKIIKDSYYNSETRFYQYPNGLRLVFTQKEDTVETNLAVIIGGGSRLENKIGLPSGTAHLYEHISAGNPNKILPTKREFQEFKQGTRNRSAINHNAFTSQKVLTYIDSANTKNSEVSLDRLLKFSSGVVIYPEEFISKYIAKEKKIVLNEIIARPKRKYDGAYWFYRFLFDNKYPEFFNPVTVFDKRPLNKK